MVTLFYAVVFSGLCIGIGAAVRDNPAMWPMTMLLIPMGIWAAFDVYMNQRD